MQTSARRGKDEGGGNAKYSLLSPNLQEEGKKLRVRKKVFVASKFEVGLGGALNLLTLT